jgi:hypothetical protein
MTIIQRQKKKRRRCISTNNQRGTSLVAKEEVSDDISFFVFETLNPVVGDAGRREDGVCLGF